MTRFQVLFVCIGNVCRSPLGERLLAARLDGERFEVRSAGIAAMVGSPMVPEAAAHLAAYGGGDEGFVSTQLVPDPYGRGDEAHEVAARLMAGAVERIAEGLTP